ncbi:MAG: sterol carrier family protein [Propionibacteriaceae bacterium]|jgi:hypothetical protein|nr:sterol carrier family protein [Propionibacteriaceae bacterium]
MSEVDATQTAASDSRTAGQRTPARAQEVRRIAQAIHERYAGHSIELRVPPYSAVQLRTLSGDGSRHTRGTPPNVVEIDPETFLALAQGSLSWDEAFATGRLSVSGAHARDVSQMLQPQ